MQSPKPREVRIIFIIALVLGMCWDLFQHLASAESPPEWPTATPAATMTAPAPSSGYPAPPPPPVEPYPAPYPPPGYPSFLPFVAEESYP